MAKDRNTRATRPEQPGMADGRIKQLGIYRQGLPYKEASQRFFRERVGEEAFQRAMSCDGGREHPYVPARILLSQSDWEKYVWIEEYGSLDGFPE